MEKSYFYCRICPEDEEPIHNINKQPEALWICLQESLSNLNSFLKALANGVCVFLRNKKRKQRFRYHIPNHWLSTIDSLKNRCVQLRMDSTWSGFLRSFEEYWEVFAESVSKFSSLRQETLERAPMMIWRAPILASESPISSW